MHTPYRLAKPWRLKSSKAIAGLFFSGNMVRKKPILLVYQWGPAKTGCLVSGFTVPKRAVKKAVNRNRIKRVMREAYRKQETPWPALPNDLQFMWVYQSAEPADFKLIYEKMTEALLEVKRREQL